MPFSEDQTQKPWSPSISATQLSLSPSSAEKYSSDVCDVSAKVVVGGCGPEAGRVVHVGVPALEHRLAVRIVPRPTPSAEARPRAVVVQAAEQARKRGADFGEVHGG